MLIDHVGALLVPPWSHLYLPMRCIGRLAFPIFAYFVAEGCRRTRRKGRYLLRLAIFAAVAQLPFSLAFQRRGGSVILTFFLAACAVFLLELMQAREALSLGVLLALLPISAAALLRTDYGWKGAALVVLLWCAPRASQQLLLLGGWLLFFYWGRCIPALGGAVDPALLGVYLPQGLCAVLSLPLLALYRGERGRGGKWFFYCFYPAHLLILWLVGNLI